MYSQNGAGLGHFRRSATVAGAIVRNVPDAVAIIASRALAPISTIPLPERTDVLKLPTLAPLGRDATGERRVLMSEEPALMCGLRTQLLHTLLEASDPVAVLVDNEPRGLQDELVEPLRALRHRGGTRILCGMRDIRGSVEHVVEKWAATGADLFLAEVYDEVLVYGDAGLFDTASAYGLGSRIGVATTTVGYVFEGTALRSPAQVRGELGVPDGVPLVAVTVGSGADGNNVIEAYLDHVVPNVDAFSVVVGGPVLAAQDQRRFQNAVDERCGFVTTYDTVSLVHAADAVVCRGGYNSVCEAVHAGHRPAVVPRHTSSGEQETRAEVFARQGLVEIVGEADLSSRLVGAVSRQLVAARSASPFDPMASADRAARSVAGVRT